MLFALWFISIKAFSVTSETIAAPTIPVMLGNTEEGSNESSSKESESIQENEVASPVESDVENFPDTTHIQFEFVSDADSAKSVSKKDRRLSKNDLYFKPDPKRATWYALVCPGLGQIYNRSYWKLPILYGGILTFTYFLGWNNRMYNEYHNAYRDILDNDPTTKSYENLINNSYNGTQSWLQQTLKSKTNRYRRYRDLSTFGLVALYMVSVVDAFVDAHLYDFTVTDDLSMKVEPVINLYGMEGVTGQTEQRAMVGLQCSFRFK